MPRSLSRPCASLGSLSLARWAVVPILAMGMAGCSQGPTHPPVFPVSGQVLLGGKPVAGASVSFVGDGTGRPAYGVTDAQGQFQLTTYAANDGASAGKHKVSVSKTAGANPQDDGSMEAAEKRANQPVEVPKSEIPERYADWSQSGLEFTVTEAGPNNFKIELQP